MSQRTGRLGRYIRQRTALEREYVKIPAQLLPGGNTPCGRLTFRNVTISYSFIFVLSAAPASLKKGVAITPQSRTSGLAGDSLYSLRRRALNSMPSSLQQLSRLLRWHWPTQKKPLRIVARVFLQEHELRDALDSLCGNVDA